MVYNNEEIEIIVRHLRSRGYRYLDTYGTGKDSPLHACNKIINWLKKKGAVCLEDLKEIAPADYPPASRKEYSIYESYRQEFSDFKNVMFEMDIINMPAYITEEDIAELVKARLEIGK